MHMVKFKINERFGVVSMKKHEMSLNKTNKLLYLKS
jgi:hypothetical protein